MFNNFIKIELDGEYIIGNPNHQDPFTLLRGGSILIFDELLKIHEEEFDLNHFVKKFAKEYQISESFIREDVELVINALKEEEMGNGSGNMKIENEDTYSYVYNRFNKEKVFKVFIELTYACNLKCKHCYLGNDINNVQTYFTFERARKVIDQLDQIGVIEINFTGGELFANKDALRIIEYACSKNFIINILTNGTLVTEEIINKLTELPISGVRILMYGMKEFHDNFVGVKGAFDKSLQTLIRLNERKRISVQPVVLLQKKVLILYCN